MFSSMSLLKGLSLFYCATSLMVVTALPKHTQQNQGKSVFPFKKYEEYEISHGTAGHALKNATDVWIKPFGNMDLATVTDEDLDNIKKMAQTAVDNEKFFVEAGTKAKSEKNPTLVKEINAAMLANKVLKILGTNQTLTIMKAKGMKNPEYESSFEDLKTKLTKNVAADKKNSGITMTSYLVIGKHSKSQSSSHSSSSSSKNPTSTDPNKDPKQPSTQGSDNDP